MKTRLICTTLIMIAILAVVAFVCDIADSAWPLVAIPFCFLAIPFAKVNPCEERPETIVEPLPIFIFQKAAPKNDNSNTEKFEDNKPEEPTEKNENPTEEEI